MATISSVTAAPDYFPEAALTISGSGFGGSPGQVFLVFPDLGGAWEYDVSGATWSGTTITGLTLPVISTEDASPPDELPPTYLNHDFYIVILPSGSTVGARSASYTFVPSTVVNTELPFGTIVMGTSVDEDAPICQPFGGPIGFVSGFDNPGYTVYWYTTPDEDGEYQADTSTSSETGIAPLGTGVLRSVATFGFSFSTQIPA